MPDQPTHIPVTDVPEDTRTFLDQVLSRGRSVVVEVEDGRVALITPGQDRKPRRRSPQSKQARIAAAIATAGSAADLDVEEMLDELERLDKEVPPTPIIE